MSAPPPRCIGRNRVPRLEKIHELGARVGYRARVETSKADVDMTFLPKAPAVAAEIPAEIELGLFGRNTEGGRLAWIDHHLHLLRRDERRTIGGVIQHSGHWTKVAARTDEHGRPDGLVDDPPRAFTADTRDRRAKHQTGAGASQQIMIELTTADAEAHGAVIRDVERAIDAD